MCNLPKRQVPAAFCFLACPGPEYTEIKLGLSWPDCPFILLPFLWAFIFLLPGNLLAFPLRLPADYPVGEAVFPRASDSRLYTDGVLAAVETPDGTRSRRRWPWPLRLCRSLRGLPFGTH